MSWHLMRPEWLWTLLPALALGAWLWRQRGRSGSWSRVIAPELLPYLVGSNARGGGVNLLPLIIAGWMLAAVAASGPSWEKIPQPVHQKQDALVLILDLSYSMKSTDLPPSRLDRARQKLLDLLQRRREGQTGLIAYAGDAHIVTPLTDDTPTIANLLPALSPDMMPLPGSHATAAVDLAVDLLHSAGILQGRILLVTDDVAQRDHQALSKRLAGSGAQLSIMGVGTSTGAPIPLPQGGFVKDSSGTIVMPGLPEQSLRTLARATGGRYMRMQIDDSDLDYLLPPERTLTDAQMIALDRTADAWEDKGYWFILLLLPLALGLFRRGWVLCLLPLLLVTQPQPASAGIWQDLWLSPDQQGQRALREGDNETAAALFENPDWAGVAAYRSGDFEAANEYFSSSNSDSNSGSGSDSDHDNADAWYNRGNALARAGKLDEAIDAYKKSLTLQPDASDARENLALLEQLKQQQQEQQQKQQQEQEQEQEKKQEQEQKQGENKQDNQQQSGNQSSDQQPDSGQQSQQQDGQQQPSDNRGQAPQEEQQSAEAPAEQQPDETPGEGEQAGEQAQEDDSEPGEASGGAPQQPAESEAADSAQQQAQMAPGEAAEQERDQAMEQWLRRIPDDPSGLLREKFRYESRQRQEQGATRDDETYW